MEMIRCSWTRTCSPANLSRIGGNGTDLAYQFNDTVGGASTNSGFETLLTSLTPQADTLYTQLFQRFD